MKYFLGIVLLIVSLVVIFAGLAGFVPWLSDFLGTNVPRDLGVRFTPADSQKVQEKTGVLIVSLPATTPVEESYQLSGQRNANLILTGKEATALINNRPWKYYPFSNLQLKIFANDSLEISGIVNVPTLLEYAQSMGFESDDVDKALAQYHIPRMNMPFDIKGSGNVIDNIVSLNIVSLELGRISIPSSVIKNNLSKINTLVQEIVNRQKGFSAKSLIVKDGEIVFLGTLPTKEFVVFK